MSIFKHKNSSQCLSFGDLAHSFTNEQIKLEPCPSNLSDIKKMPDTINGNYKITDNIGNCIQFNENGDNLNISDVCDDSSIFTIHNSYNNYTKTPSQIKVNILFNDNSSTNHSKDTIKRRLTIFSHKYNVNTKNENNYFILYNFNSNDLNKLFINNGKIECNIKNIIDEYDNNNNLIQSTTYYLCHNNKNNSLYFSSNNNNIQKLFIESVNRIGNQDMNIINKNDFYIGYNNSYVKLDTINNKFGLTLSNIKEESTKFKIINIDNDEQFKILYDNNNLFSFINPNNKIKINYKENKLITQKINNDEPNLFVLPYKKRNNIEGFVNNNSYQNMEFVDSLKPTDVRPFINTLKQRLKDNDYELILEDINNFKTIINKSSYGNDKKHYSNVVDILNSLNIIINNTKDYNTLINDGVKNENMKELENKKKIINDEFEKINVGSIANLNLSIDNFIINFDIINDLNNINQFLKINENSLFIYSQQNYNYIDNSEQANDFDIELQNIKDFIKIINTDFLINEEKYLNIPNKTIQTDFENKINLLKQYYASLKNKEKYIIISKNLGILFNKFKNNETVETKKFKINKMKFIDILNSFKTKYDNELLKYLDDFFNEMNKHDFLYDGKKINKNNSLNFMDNLFLFKTIKEDLNYSNTENNCRILQIFSNFYEKLSNYEIVTINHNNIMNNDPNQFYNINFLLTYINNNEINMIINQYMDKNGKSVDSLSLGPLTRPFNTSKKNNKKIDSDSKCIENFKGNIDMSIIENDDLYPNDPKNLNICENNYDGDLLQDGFTYDGNTMVSYLNSRFDKYYIYNDSSKSWKCKKNMYGEKIKPSINITYNYLNKEKTWDDRWKKKSYKNEICNNIENSQKNKCKIDTQMKLIYNTRNNKITKVKVTYDIIDNNKTKNIYVTLENNLDVYKHRLCPFYKCGNRNINRKKKFRTKWNVEELELLTSTDDIDNIDLGNENSLYSDDSLLRIVIDSDKKKMKIQYVEKIIDDIEGAPNTKFGYDDYLYVKELDDNIPENKMGNNLNKVGFIGPNNQINPIKTQNSLLKKTNNYTEFGAYGLSMLKEDVIDKKSECSNNTNCIGYYEKNSGTKYPITIENKDYIYKDPSHRGTINLKNYGVKIDSLNIPSNNRNFNMYNIDEYISFDKNDTSMKTGILKDILNNKSIELKENRKTIKNNFSNLVEMFNKLTENELKMLKETGINSHKLNELVNKFDNLYNLKDKNIKIKNLFENQKLDSQSIYNKSQYTMAITGILSLGSLLFLMNYMKK